MKQLLNDILECIDYVSQCIKITLPSITEKWDTHSQIYAGVAEKIDVAWRVPLDADLLEEFPDVRTNVAKKLELLASDQLSILRILSEQTYEITEIIKTKIDSINTKLEQMSFVEHNELQPAIREIVIWMDDCFTCFHCLYMQLDFSMMTLHMSGEDFVNNLINAIKQDEKDKLVLGKSQTYMQNCTVILKFLENKNKIKITS